MLSELESLRDFGDVSLALKHDIELAEQNLHSHGIALPKTFTAIVIQIHIGISTGRAIGRGMLHCLCEY